MPPTSTQEASSEEPQHKKSNADDELPSYTVVAAVKSTLTTIRSEIHLIIFKILDPVSSTCLGTTAKSFYATHFNLHGKVDLTKSRSIPPDPTSGAHLFQLLGAWAGPDLAIWKLSMKCARKDSVAMRLAHWEPEVMEVVEMRFIATCNAEMHRNFAEMGGWYVNDKWVRTVFTPHVLDMNDVDQGSGSAYCGWCLVYPSSKLSG